MSHDHATAHLAVRLAEHHLHSARPDAPVEPEAAVRPPRARRTRATLAGALHRLAQVLEPAERPIAATHRPR